MKQLFFSKRLRFLFFLLCCSVSIYADDNDLITQQITITLSEAGTLPDKIGSSKKYKITNLKIVGEINGTDMKFIREMGGRNVNGNKTSGKLSIINLSEAKIVEGGGEYNTKDNVLGAYAFSGCSSLTSVTIPSGVTSIRECAFEGCSGLTSIIIPSGVTSIGECAFKGCSGLTSMIIPSGVKSIGPYVFSGCSGLTSIDIPSGVKLIGSNAFAECSGLTSIIIPSGVTSIGECAFKGCSGLTSIDIPSGVMLGESVFSGCSGLTSIDIPSGVTSIRECAFEGCSGLTSMIIPSGVKSIEPYAFSGCSGLTSMIIHSGVKSIGSYAFEGCSGLTSIIIPSGVTYIGRLAFCSCNGLTTVYVSWQSPLSVYDVFYDVDVSECTLYVPQGTYQDYWLANVWGDFGKIVEYDVTGIDKTTTSSDAKVIIRHSVNGQRLSAPTKGLNIVKYSDGSVRKVLVK